MADKREKIAAARKKLKQYQSKQKQDTSCRSENDSERETPIPGSMNSSSSFSDLCAASVTDSDIRNQNHLPQEQPLAAEKQPSSYGVSNYFNASGGSQAMQDFLAMEPQVAPPLAPVEASVHSINRISSEIGQLIANASADLGPQNTILELESEKADLLRTLNAQRLENDELRLRLRNNQSLTEELKNDIDRLKLENSTKVTTELGPIQEQLRLQTQAVGMLVGEKAELTATLSKYQSLVKEKTAESDELQNRLKASRATVQKLEKEIEGSRQSGRKFDELERTISKQLHEHQEEANKFRKLYEDLLEDLGEMKQKLTVRNKEYRSVQDELEQSRYDLSLAKLRIEQLSSDDDQDYNAKIESLSQQNLIKSQQVKDLQELIKQIGNERDQSNQQYQNYVLHLNKEVANLADKIQELTEENNRLSTREENLVRHVGELERQIQQQMIKQKTYAAQNQEDPSEVDGTRHTALEAEIRLLKEKVSTMEVERAEYMKENESVEQLRQKYEEKNKQNEERIAELLLTVDRLQMDKPDFAKLIAEIESGKVGASRAVSQNMELKAQLEEMQKAFVQISNDKLELTDKLQTELHLGKEMKATYGHLESELNSIREKLHYKDEEMIRLAHETVELNKQILQQHQEIDRLRYYESRANDGNVLQLELQRTQEQLQLLQNHRNDTLSSANKIEHSCNNDHDNETHHHGHHDPHREIEILKQEKEELVKVINSFQSRAKASPNHSVENGKDQSDGISDNVSAISLPNSEAMEKLQERFRRTMLEVAELTDEKQRLEHLVMQLQGETETIGEYITLYQQQRRLLKQKDMERDHQLQRLANDREMMKLKLKELNSLVHQLVLEKGGGSGAKFFSSPTPLSDQLHSTTSPLIDLPTTPDSNSRPANENGDRDETKVHIKPTETAGRILSLLTDIKEANVAYGSGVQHCSCCSGRLETV
ncbi:golgin subfamily A member 2 [Toxorhynchites rutilus septentrionalis]|uniref:golgin subfamily A member 2 n=1 Tax=Toxorhynchites rutilus septentrionalis TaxID=329112 RepID=UPI0024793C8F|nr:golgin subfamily A member 2 [Toxorhynchites rutilus septentrionalis]